MVSRYRVFHLKEKPMKVSIKRPVEHLKHSSDHYGVEEAFVEVHERIKVRVSKTDIGIWIDGVKTLQFIPQSVVDPRYYATEPEEPKKAPPKKRVPPDPEGAKKRMELDPVSALWAGVYENFRNIIKNFWRD